MDYSAADFGTSLVFTIIIYSLPILIYRYGIKKEPIDKKKAKIIVIIYAILSAIIMTFLLAAIGGSISDGGTLLLWAFVNYFVLTYKKKPDEAPEDKFIVCPICHTRNPKGTTACKFCANKLDYGERN